MENKLIKMIMAGLSGLSVGFIYSGNPPLAVGIIGCWVVYFGLYNT